MIVVPCDMLQGVDYRPAFTCIDIVFDINDVLMV